MLRWILVLVLGAGLPVGAAGAAPCRPSGAAAVGGAGPGAWVECLRRDLALLTYPAPAPADPMAWHSPASRQALLRWNGRHFVAAGVRTLPEPRLTASRFLGALQAGDLPGAARLAASPAVADKARDLLGAAPGAWADAEDPARAARIRRAELHNWQLLPAEFRSAPVTRYTFPINRGNARAMLHMARAPEGWIVADVQSVRGRLQGTLTHLPVETAAGQTAQAAPTAAATPATKAIR